MPTIDLNELRDRALADLTWDYDIVIDGRPWRTRSLTAAELLRLASVRGDTPKAEAVAAVASLFADQAGPLVAGWDPETMQAAVVAYTAFAEDFAKKKLARQRTEAAKLLARQRAGDTHPPGRAGASG